VIIKPHSKKKYCGQMKAHERTPRLERVGGGYLYQNTIIDISLKIMLIIIELCEI
jgi:hypothetical protein